MCVDVLIAYMQVQTCLPCPEGQKKALESLETGVTVVSQQVLGAEPWSSD